MSDVTMTRLDEMLIDEATQGLATDERSELERLLEIEPNVDRDAFACSCAVLDVALATVTFEPMPERVRTRLLALAETQARRWSKPASSSMPPAAPPASFKFPSVLPWLVAAASIVIAIAAWSPWGADAGRDPMVARNKLLEDAPDARTIAWEDPGTLGVTGDVVWSNERQEGYLRFTGLPVNDPSVSQYQLWIFDGARAKYNAVDGGVFDAKGPQGTLVVPVAATLEVFEPALFAITTEPPGGVPKHDPELDPDRFRIILTAAAG